MSTPLRRCLGSLVTFTALIGYLAAVAEAIVPDRHDWDGMSPSVSAVANDPTDPSDQAPIHPVHVCHEGHQHILDVTAPTPAAGATRYPAVMPEQTPSSTPRPPIRLSLRPPIA